MSNADVSIQTWYTWLNLSTVYSLCLTRQVQSDTRLLYLCVPYNVRGILYGHPLRPGNCCAPRRPYLRIVNHDLPICYHHLNRYNKYSVGYILLLPLHDSVFPSERSTLLSDSDNILHDLARVMGALIKTK